MAYLAMYKDKGDWVDKVIRFFTGKPYSHCELAFEVSAGVYQCYSSSPRDGGVRTKTMKLPADKWDLIPICVDSDAQAFFAQTAGKKYDFLGAIGVVIGTPEVPNKWYCSEWCHAAIFGKVKQLSPNQLAKEVQKCGKNKI